MIGGASGIGIGLDFGVGKWRKQTQEKPYIDQAILDSLVCVVSTYGKTNADSDRNILKDKTKKGNDLRLLNFGFAGNSGYGLYGTDFTTYQTVPASVEIVRTPDKLTATNNGKIGQMIIYKSIADGNSYPNIPSFRIKVTNLTSSIRYYYISETNTENRTSIPINSDGIYDLPESKNNLFNGASPVNIGFSTDAGSSVTIEQIPEGEGWLYTDGVDDLIESVKPVSEMLEGSNEITVVSIIHQISNISDTARASTNNIRSTNDTFGARNLVELQGVGKTGIYGYTCANIKVNSPSLSIVNSILGDKNDYSCSGINFKEVDTLSIQGFINQSDGSIKEVSQIAYAGGFIANKVLTTDEINQIIAYYNLDRPGQIIKPQLYCSIKKQGITNDNHAEFNDQLIDFLGGHNIQLNNVGWKLDSGIGLYQQDFTAWTKYNVAITNIDHKSITIINNKESNATLYKIIKVGESSNNDNSFKIKVIGSIIKLGYQYINNIGKLVTLSISKEGTYTIPISYNSLYAGNTNTWIGFASYLGCNCIIEQIPENSDALYLDGISDFGKATGLPVLKDYTVVAERARLTNDKSNPVLSKSKFHEDVDRSYGSFVFEIDRDLTYSYNSRNTVSKINDDKILTYQSKYIYNKQNISAGEEGDDDSMWLGTVRDGDSRFSKIALWSLMLFPYSLSEFLLERQLKKYKTGTLYPDMIEFRPIIKSNVRYKSVRFFYERRYGESTEMFPGEYYSFVGEVAPTIYIEPYGADEPKSITVNGKKSSLHYNEDGTYSSQFFYTKSPQKIDIIIEKNAVLSNIKNLTLISNKQLIKNNK